MKISKGKQRIIDATIRVLKEQPIEDVTMRNIAKEAGVTTGSLYHHYKNKDDLLFDVMLQSLYFTNKLSDMIKTDTTNKTGSVLLEEVNLNVEKRVRKVEQQKLYIQFFSDIMRAKSGVKERYQENYTNSLKNTGNLIIDAFELEDNGLKEIVASILVASLDGVAMQQSLDVLPENLDEYIKHLIEFFNYSIPAYLNNHKL